MRLLNLASVKKSDRNRETDHNIDLPLARSYQVGCRRGSREVHNDQHVVEMNRYIQGEFGTAEPLGRAQSLIRTTGSRASRNSLTSALVFSAIFPASLT